MQFPRRHLHFVLRWMWLGILALLAQALNAAELHVMTSGTFTAAYLELKPVYERLTGDTLVTEATSVGAGETRIPRRLERGERADIVIMDDAAVVAAANDGLVIPSSRVELVRTRMGMAVRAGAPIPDVSTVEAFKRALLAAKSIGYSASVSGDYLSKELFPRLGIAEAVRDKSRRIEVERVGRVLARGDIEIGFQQISELKPVEGITLVGPLPDEVQLVSVFSAGVPAKSPVQKEAKAFIAFLASDAAVEVIRKSGLEPIQAGVPAGAK